MFCNLTPYNPIYDQQIHDLERSIVQGKKIQLQIVKDHFLDRSAAFEKREAVLAMDNENVIGTSIGTETKMIVNGKILRAGFVFDTKVDPSYRNRGVGRMMAAHHKKLFTSSGLTKNFTTLKLSNTPVVRLASKAIGSINLYRFVYLTIPTSVRVVTRVVDAKQPFSVTLFDAEKTDQRYYVQFDSGLACFNTHLLYGIRIVKIHPLLTKGIALLRKIRPKKYSNVPLPGELMEFTTLFNHTASNIGRLNEVLEHLQEDRKKYLLVCCRKNDGIYNLLKKYSINSYDYYLLADFGLKENDCITIDVRCL